MFRFLKKKIVGIFLILLLGTMATLAIYSMKDDSATMDERAHIGAGYSYLKLGDYRLNPEHPPLVKDISALPLLFLNLNFPYQYFKSNLNSQWDIGWQFLYDVGNNPDLMLFWGRLPIVLLSLLLGYLVFRWAKELYGVKAGLFALFLYVFDANIIAHSRFITTDLGISLALFLHLYFLWRFLKNPALLKFVWVGVTFGIVLVTKFSAALLAPIYILLFLYLIFRKSYDVKVKNIFSNFFSGNIKNRILSYGLSFGFIVLLGVFFMYLFYIPHVYKMPDSTQNAVIKEALPDKVDTDLIYKLSNSPILRPLAQYFLGFSMVSAHVTGGHKTFLLGNVSNGFWYYYLVAFPLKTAIPIMIFIILSFVFWKRLKPQDKFAEFMIWSSVLVFFLMAMRGSLNLGIRYLLPIYPLMYVSVSKLANLLDFSRIKKLSVGLSAILVGLLAWHFIGTVKIHPHYLAFFNEFVGPRNGYRYIANSNLDWGQDLKRLAKYVDENNIDKIKIDYFGSGDLNYYLEDKAIQWFGEYGKPKGYFAISASTYAQVLGTFADTGDITDPNYRWLKNYRPVATIGYSIFVFRID